MMQLPTTLIEAEARAFARNWLAGVGRPDASGLIDRPDVSGISILNPTFGNLWLREALKRTALVHPLNMMWVIDQARDGWDVCDSVLRELAIEIVDCGAPLPTALGAYTMELMRGHPRRTRGPKREAYVFQDIIFAGLVVGLVEKFGLKPTRNSFSKQVSACDVVADTVNDAKIGRAVKYKAIEVLWFRWGKGLLSDQYWANLSRPKN